jgi:mannose/fructose/N-acetylgalactosamine-specific phosphotransferase system component IIB
VKGAGAYLWFRIDDRLLHGQVALGWGRHLAPRAYLLVDDDLAADETSAAIFALAAPADVTVTVVDQDAALRMIPEEHTIVLVRSVAAAARLVRGGVRGPVNLGGVHRHEGAEQYLPYLFLDRTERDLLRELMEEGVEFVVQDLPENSPRELSTLLDAGPSAERA